MNYSLWSAMCEQKLHGANMGTYQLYVSDLAISKFLQLAYCLVRHRETYASHVLVLVIHTDRIDLERSQKTLSVLYIKEHICTWLYNLIKMQAHFKFKKKKKCCYMFYMFYYTFFVIFHLSINYVRYIHLLISDN